MPLRKVTIVETVRTTYVVEINVDDSATEAEAMAEDLIVNNADDEEFMESVTEKEELISKEVTSIEV